MSLPPLICADAGLKGLLIKTKKLFVEKNKNNIPSECNRKISILEMKNLLPSGQKKKNLKSLGSSSKSIFQRKVQFA